MEQTQTVTLKNGAVEEEALVSATMHTLWQLFNEKPAVFLELVTKCKDKSHQWFGNAEQICKDLTLVQPDGRIHGSIRSVVLSAIEGDGIDMVLVSPLKKQPEEEIKQ